MHRSTFVGVVGAVALIVAGCSSDDTSVAPSPSISPSSSAQTPAQNFSQPLVAQKPAPPGAVPGLLQSTNPDQRAKQVQSNINSSRQAGDPFSVIPLSIPRPSPTSTPASSQTTSDSSSQIATGSPSAPRPGATARFPRNRPLSSPLPPIASRPLNSGKPPQPSAPLPAAPAGRSGAPVAAVPAAPSTTLASAVEVSGVVQTGRDLQAIIKAPNEASSRYVHVGQRISNGQVLVKRIEMNLGSDPIVILEENGVEVARAVGVKPAGSQQST